MSSAYQSFVDYVSLEKSDDGDIQFNTEQIDKIRVRFEELYDGQNINDDYARQETVKKLMDELKITDDETNFEYVDSVVQQDSVDDIKIELRDKFLPPMDMNEPIDVFTDKATTSSSPMPLATTEVSSTLSPPTTGLPTTSAKKPKSQQLIENKPEIVDNVICIIHKKGPVRVEIETFFREFLFLKVQPPQQESIPPKFDGETYDLDTGTILDLFIRQQMKDRDLITFSSPRSRFRLVEPISLTDEFDSWTFDHFRGLMDFWLAIDLTNQTKFPNKWKLSPTANIKYVIVAQLPSGDAQQTTKHIERPSTKQLDSFIRDVCHLEDNGLADEWLEALRKEENIETYAHLANLNQQEWEKIDELPMNALKIIKFYVDREKQTTEERKKKNNVDSSEKKDDSYSKSELRASLHMIKLYFVRQVEDQMGIPTLPKLEKYCVETAFKEMRADGYEDDGLFDEMELFFQPLTITEDELAIDSALITSIVAEESKKKISLDEKISKLEEELKNNQTKLETEREGLNQKQEEIDVESKKPVPKNFQERKKQENEWAEKYDAWKKTKANFTKKIKGLESEIKKTETSIANYKTELNEVEKSLTRDRTKIDQRLVKHHRGFIMFGPPGTGKSVIMSKLANKIGIAMLGPPLAAGELERPYVGQSEAIILSLCLRGNRLPHLMCCVSIDEIDSLAPRRDEDSSEGKVAKISVLLSVIEGIKDVPNLMFFSATNRLHMMDEAFLRRMSGKFFVGRPSSNSRKKILDGIPDHIVTAEIRKQLAIATTNFSGAALKALTSAITVHDLAVRRKKTDYKMEESEALTLADRVAQQYQLFLGLDTLPRLILQNLYTRQQSSTKKPEKTKIGLLDKYRCTGKIIISLEKNERCVRIEGIQPENDKLHIIEDNLDDTEQSLQQLLERITNYGNDRNVQLLQLIDLNLLSSKGAYDQEKIFETLKERYDECIAYKRSMIVYDLDSLIGVNRSESESSTGTSVSSSVVNQSIYTYVVSRFREAKLEASKAKENEVNERWAIAVTREQFLLKKFTADVDFTLTKQQEEEQENEKLRSTVRIFCAKCRDNYLETENKMGACSYHDGFVYDNSSDDLDQYTPTAAIQILNKEESLPPPETTQKEQTDRRKSRFKYICCSATLQAGSSFNGCKKDEHNFGDDNEKKQHAKMKRKNLIAKWENICLNSDDNYEAYMELLDSRGKSLPSSDSTE